MATKYSSWVQGPPGNLYRAVLTYTSTTVGNTQVRIDATLQVEVAANVTYDAGTAKGTLVVGGTSSGSVTYPQVLRGPVTATITTLSKTVNRTHASQSVSVSGTVSIIEGAASASAAVTVAAKPSYRVTYHANGGSGAPSAQTKWYGETLALSILEATPPAGVDYFLGWATSANGTPTYCVPEGVEPWVATSKSTYSSNANLDLYAIYGNRIDLRVWEVDYTEDKTWKRIYKIPGKAVTLPTATPTKSGCTFLGWNTSSYGDETNYAPGSTVSADNLYFLYAIFVGATARLDQTVRTDSAGAPEDDGMYSKISGSWQLISPTRGTVTVTARYRETGSSSWNSLGTLDTISKTGRDDIGGSVSTTIFGEGALDLEKTYQVQLTVTFSYTYNGTSRTATNTSIRSVPYGFITMEFLAGGHGVTFGQAATAEGLHSYMASHFHELVRLDKALRQDAAALGNTKIGVDVPSSAVYGANHAAYDAAGRNIFYSRFGRTSGDALYRSFVVQRRDANDANVQNGFYVGINANGEPYVHFTSGGREAWLDGLGVGTVVENDISTAVSVASGSWKTIGSLALTAGVWVLQYNVLFASNATGRRAVTTSVTRDSAGTTAEQRHWMATQQATNGMGTVMGHTAVYNANGTNTTNLNVLQNSGSALNVTGFMRAVRIG